MCEDSERSMSTVFNFISSGDINTNYHGTFNDITTTISADKTNLSPNVLDMKKIGMKDKRNNSGDFKACLIGSFNNDIEAMAHALGLSIDDMHNYLLGRISIPDSVVHRLEEYTFSKGGYFQFGDRIEINNSGDNYSQSFSDILESEDIENKRLKIENSSLRKTVKEKDELIAALKETIKLLKDNRS